MEAWCSQSAQPASQRSARAKGRGQETAEQQEAHGLVEHGVTSSTSTRGLGLSKSK